MTYVSHELECALESYQWCRGLCFVATAILEGNSPLQIPMPGRQGSAWT